MANQQLFKTLLATLPATTAVNQNNAPAYAYSARHKLAQLAVTGCMNHTYYANGEAQLADVLALCAEVDAAFIAKTAIYARQRGQMKDMPALLTAVLASKDAALLPAVFGQVIDNGKMLRNFVQIMRSGATGRKSLGSRPKKLVQVWLNKATEMQLLQASVGNAPSLADVVKMVHPKPTEPWREAFFAWLIGKPFDAAQLPPLTRELLAFRAGGAVNLPQVPFQLLSNEKLTARDWAQLAQTMGWQALRMNLNTLARQGALALPGVAQQVADRLADPAAVAKARVYPYQLLIAYQMAGADVPGVIKEALQDALDAALSNVPKLEGQVVVCPDVSGSMHSPVTGYRQGATTSVRCVDVAALVAAAMLRLHPDARVLPFEVNVVDIKLNPRDAVMTNAQKLAAVGGGGTNCSAPLARLVAEGAKVDTVIMVSDNESWINARRAKATETMKQWALIKRRNPQARLICIDLQPYGTTQAQEQQDILNVGGFGDAVFDVIAQFAAGSFGAGHWVDAIDVTPL
ncbi:60 kDa SS-A/Ro ribonucleoprotein [Andreprevotia sp. IGB-42]|uniref:TROVE domain-containing protein n=1 Tax=Andreprevotia sp. IGB-42 TaxID=2497473 RepID=UPI0013587C42|nr:TROVE domain-containing protein [Andreprevotia sp. IGB-42]KAF0812218.1 60 kDa SS-A/Ro ribonucleoprotein [Andreprevotia sp. IGB-42]